LGTPRLITSASGARRGSHAYYGFGEEAGTITEDLEAMKLTGHERDLTGSIYSDTSLNVDYMHARQHSPIAARFFSFDSHTPKPRQAQTWNRYTYVSNNPVRLIDPNGLEAIDPAIARFLGGYYGVNVSHVQVFGGPLARTLTFIAGFGRADAVTFGQRVFFSGQAWSEYKAKTVSGIGTTGHEVHHTIDYKQMGFFGFVGEYLRQWVSVGFSYSKIPLELAAFADQAAIEQMLRDNPYLLESIQNGSYGQTALYKDSPVHADVYGGLSFLFGWQGGLFIDGINLTGAFTEPIRRRP